MTPYQQVRASVASMRDDLLQLLASCCLDEIKDREARKQLPVLKVVPKREK